MDEHLKPSPITRSITRALTRRTLLKGALACGASAALGATTKGPQATFPVDPRDRLAVATYPFRAIIDSPRNEDRETKKTGMDLAAFARYIRTEFKVRGIEPLSWHFPSTEPEDITKLKAAFDAADVFVANIPVDDRVELCSDDEEKRNAGNLRYRRWIDIAVALGSPSIRIWIPKCSDFADLPKAVHALKPTIDYAASRNICLNLENDDPINASVSRTITALQLAASPWLRALPDFGNGLETGDDHANAQGVERMFAHAWNITHVKDAAEVKGKRKTTPIDELFAIARSSGFRGYYSMESDSDVDPVVDTKHLIEQSLQLI
jgi:sugar phosphate isomerase/epimerase